MDRRQVGERWLRGVLSQVDFQLRGGDRGRRDENFDWNWFRRRSIAHFVDARRRVREVLGRMRGKVPNGYSTEWLRRNAASLWETCEALVDDLNRRQFDDAIALKITGYRRAFFPAEAFYWPRVLREQIQAIHPDYRFHFGHHTPCSGSPCSMPSDSAP